MKLMVGHESIVTVSSTTKRETYYGVTSKAGTGRECLLGPWFGGSQMHLNIAWMMLETLY